MITTRVYRPARDSAAALAEIRRATGSQFCPDVVAALERTFAAGRIDVESDAHPQLAAAS
jgi:HD-GYP domain-containing protein (c-di-GMP phosphodiesterase class II)